MSIDTASRLPAGPVVELEVVLGRVHELAEIPVGPGLATALAGIDESLLPGLALTFVVAARCRQANHERGELLASIDRILRHGVLGAEIRRKPNEFAVDEVRALLRLSRKPATLLCELAWDLHRRLPAVLDAMRDGRLDQPRGQVFSTWTQGLTREHADSVVAQALPQAPDLTTGELSALIARLAVALDPEWVRRRYERALANRRVVGTKNPDGTANLTGHDLPFDDVAGACARLDAMALAAKAAGHPDRLDHLRADLLVGLVGGRYTGMTDRQIITSLLATAKNRPATPTDDDFADDEQADAAEDDDAAEDELDDVEDAEHGEDDAEDWAAEDDRSGDASDEDDVADDGTVHADPAGDGAAATDDAADAATSDAAAVDDGADDAEDEAAAVGPVRSSIGRRGGLRLSVGLLTIAGADQRPGDLAGWGPVHAELACTLASRIGSWWCVLTAGGVTEAVVPIRRRPTPKDPAQPGLRGEVWLHTDRNGLRLLHMFAAEVGPGWGRVLAEITATLDMAATGPPNGDPRARLPGATLRRWIALRDGTCTFPGCRTPAHRTDLDHTTEYRDGGATVDTGLAAACRHDHRLRHDGDWQVNHSEPGRVTWTSPLGRTYERHTPPSLLDLPYPRHDAIDERDPEPPLWDPPPWADPDTCLQQEPEPPPPPAVSVNGTPGGDDDEIPPF